MKVWRRYIQTASRLRGFEAPTVWSEFSPLAVQTGSVNLGQGVPGWKTPEFIKETMTNAVNADANQYAFPAGDSVLLSALSEHYSPIIGRKIDPVSEIATCSGATEALYAIMMGLINEGDEVVILEPAFDIYEAQIQMAGGKAKHVPIELVDGKWKLDMNKLESQITDKTKIILINTPHNPTGKVFTVSELEDIADILRRHPHVTAVCDEVYEKLVYDGAKHVQLSSLPDMWDRTITVSSSGKTFSVTGWKVGWAMGASHLIKPIIMVNQWVQFCVSTPPQRAIAEVLRKAEEPYEGAPNYYEFIRGEYERKRVVLGAMLRDAGLDPVMPEGGFFIVADHSKYTPDQKYVDQPGPDGSVPVTRDWAFSRWLTHSVGVTPIPMSAFFSPAAKPMGATLGTSPTFTASIIATLTLIDLNYDIQHYTHTFLHDDFTHLLFTYCAARFAFCKTDEDLEEARARMVKLRD